MEGYDISQFQVAVEQMLKEIKKYRQFKNKVENALIYYEIKINKVIEYIENEYDFYYGDELKDEYQKIIEILKGSDK